MILGLISDTHDDLEAIDKAFNIFVEHGVETIVHCGDWVKPETLHYFGEKALENQMVVKLVVGNNETEEQKKEFRLIDESNQYPFDMSTELTELTFEIDGVEYAICHGHEGVMLDSLVESEDYEVVFRGHTHQPADKVYENTRVINPGAACHLTLGNPTREQGVGIYDTQSKLLQFIPIGE